MQTINLDLSTKNVIPLLNVKQGEVGRKFKAVITDAGKAYSLAGVVFSVWYAGTSGEGNYTDIGGTSAFSISDNTVTVELITQMLTNAGKGTLCLVMNTAGSDQIATWNIPYYVEAVPGAGSQEATSYYNAFQKVLEDLPYPDTTLSIPGKAADAAAVGKALTGITYLGKEGDVDSLVTPGRYACETAEVAKTLLGCPVAEPFTLDVRYADGKGPRVSQELKPAGKGARLYRQFVKYPDILSGEGKKLYDRVKGLVPQGNGYNGKPDTSWYDGSGDYILHDAADLYGLAQLVNSGNTFAGETVRLDADIIVNTGDASSWDAETTGLHDWTPIGAAVQSGTSWKFINHFAGTFDGQGYCISGLYNVQGRDNGFMCYTVNATVKNLAIINSYFETDGTESSSSASKENGQVLAAFVGRGYGITLKNLYSNATLVCSHKDYHTGGIAGFAKSNSSETDKKSPAVTHNYWAATIDSVVFDGKITTNAGASGSLVGGILGGTDTSFVSIRNSLFAGTITTNDSSVGGIVGRISENSTVDGCVAVGSINKKANVGGIVGQLHLNEAKSQGYFEVTDCHYAFEVDLNVYGGTYNKSSGRIRVNATGSKKLSAECLRHSLVPTQWESDAPNGYGLGANSGTFVSDLNACVRNGWYYTSEESTNVPYRSYFCYASVFVTARTSKQIVQRLVSISHWTHSALLRYTEDGGATWDEEWEIPPMIIGVEYRTTERHGGNPVYTKLINCGQNTHGKEVSLEYPKVIRYAARATNGVVYPFAESTSNYHRRVQISQQEIMIIAGKAAENADTVYCQIWYTK